MAELKEQTGMVEDQANLSVVDRLINDILKAYAKDPDVKFLTD